MTTSDLKQFAVADAEGLAAKTADITEWHDDEFQRKATCPAARVTGIHQPHWPVPGPKTTGVQVTDAQTGARLATRAAEPAWNVAFTWQHL